MSVALYASAPNHVVGQMLGFPGSCVLLPYVPLYRLRRHQENYCDCALVHSDEHLSRESRKLTEVLDQMNQQHSRSNSPFTTLADQAEHKIVTT